MSIVTIIAIGCGALVICGFIGYSLVRRNRLLNKGIDPKKAKFKCAVRVCEVWNNAEKTDDKYCSFHQKVQKYHIILTENDDPLKTKSMLYMTTNAISYTNGNQYPKIYKELKDAADKYKKEAKEK